MRSVHLSSKLISPSQGETDILAEHAGSELSLTTLGL